MSTTTPTRRAARLLAAALADARAMPSTTRAPGEPTTPPAKGELERKNHVHR